MIRKVLAASFAAFVGMSVPAMAQEDVRMELFKFYIVHVAADVCDIDVTKKQQDAFNRATDRLEKKVGASKTEMDATFEQVKTGAKANPRGFCAQYKSVAVKTLEDFE